MFGTPPPSLFPRKNAVNLICFLLLCGFGRRSQSEQSVPSCKANCRARCDHPDKPDPLSNGQMNAWPEVYRVVRLRLWQQVSDEAIGIYFVTTQTILTKYAFLMMSSLTK